MKLKLLLKADLEEIASIKPTDDIQWQLRVKCENCGEERPEVYVTFEDEQEIPGSRGTANLVYKCKGCKRDNTIGIVKNSYNAYTQSGKFSGIATFESRGVDITKVVLPSDGFDAEGMEGSKFRDIDLSGDWSEFDEERSAAVSIMNIELKLEVTK